VTQETLKPLKTLTARTVGEWRRWLANHHDSESEIWLVFHKRHTGRPSIDYLDALDEALCFGWVDSLIKRLDENRYARKFTPRRADSRWSDINRQRYAKLKADKRLALAGLRRSPTDRRYDPPRSVPSDAPPYIRDALMKHPAAWKSFERLSPSHRRRYIGWIEVAKQDTTKERRVQEAIRLLAEGKPLGLK
jgi:uncharacterized protein YdeI (YjbR/CyaY-like superfamily)